MRLCKSSEYTNVLQNGRKYVSTSFILLHIKNSGPTRLGLIVSRKVGGAVIRNYLKRVFREIFRIHYHELSDQLDYVIILRKNAVSKSYSQLKNEFIEINNKIIDFNNVN